jgi:hypothetical protein
MGDSKPRRSPRLVFPTPIRVVGEDITGNYFYEDTSTLVVNREGARIHLTRNPDPGRNLFIYSHETDLSGRFRVVGDRGESDGLYRSWAVEMVKAPQSIWGIEFPTLEPDDRDAVRVMLECEACHTRERLYLEEARVASILKGGGLSRECGVCKQPRLWVVVPYVDEA